MNNQTQLIPTTPPPEVGVAREPCAPETWQVETLVVSTLTFFGRLLQ
jgi:hypothetical protein